MFFEDGTDTHQFRMGFGHHLGQFGNGSGSTDTGHHVFALRVHEEFTVEFLLACSRVTREGDAGTGFFTRVAEHHGLYIDGGTPFGRNIVLAAVNDSPVIVPGAEYGTDGALQLFPRAFREFLAHAVLDEFLETGNEFLQVVGSQFRIFDFGFAMAFYLDLGNGGFKGVMIFSGGFLHSENDVAVHLNKTAVAVPSETGIAGSLGKGCNTLVIQAEIQNRIHHAGHGFASSGTDSHEKGHVFRIAELGAHDSLHVGNTSLDVGFHGCGISAPVVVVIRTNFRRNGKSGRHGQTDTGHFSKVGTFATEQVFHAGVTFGSPSAKGIYNLVRGSA